MHRCALFSCTDGYGVDDGCGGNGIGAGDFRVNGNEGAVKSDGGDGDGDGEQVEIRKAGGVGTSLFDAGDSVAREAGGDGKEFLDVPVGDEGDAVLSVIGSDGCGWMPTAIVSIINADQTFRVATGGSGPAGREKGSLGEHDFLRR